MNDHLKNISETDVKGIRELDQGLARYVDELLGNPDNVPALGGLILLGPDAVPPEVAVRVLMLSAKLALTYALRVMYERRVGALNAQEAEIVALKREVEQLRTERTERTESEAC